MSTLLININTSNLSVTKGAFISSSTIGKGNGGDITITASDTVAIDEEKSSAGYNLVSFVVHFLPVHFLPNP